MLTPFDCVNCDESSVTVSCTVNAALAKNPAAFKVLNSFGIDTCCGGRSSIGDAAAHARVDPSVVIAALDAAGGCDGSVTPRALPQAPSCSCGCR